MKPVFQTRTGTNGDCWAACLASIFEVSLEEVAQCAANLPDWAEQTELWLGKRGLFQNEIQVEQDAMGRNKFPFIAPPVGTLCVVVGRRWGASISHAVVCRALHIPADEPNCVGLQFEIIHDPLGAPKPFSVTEKIIFFGKTFK